jgi:hypothetical protein
MIKADIVSAISIYISLAIVLVLASWVFYNYDKKNIMKKMGEINQCPFCTFIFYRLTKEDISTCPRCKSLIDIKKET